MTSQETKLSPDQFYVRLPRYGNVTVAFPRKRYLELFPDSLLAAILLDPEASVIDIDNPMVTPEVLTYLQFITLYPYTPPPPGVNVKSTWAYLNIPVFRIAQSPSLQMKPYPVADVSFYKAPDLLDATDMAQPEQYWGLVYNAALVNDVDVIDYVFERVPPELTRDMDVMLMYEAVINGWPQLFTRLLNRGVDLRQNVLDEGDNFLMLLPERIQSFNYGFDGPGSHERNDMDFLRRLTERKSDQLPYLMVLAPRLVTVGHKAIVTETLRRGLLPNDLLLDIASRYIETEYPQEDVLLQLYSAIRTFPMTPFDYQPIVDKGLAQVYKYLVEERHIPDADWLNHAAALGLTEYILPVLNDPQITEDLWLQAFRLAVQRGQYAVAVMIQPKLRDETKAQLLLESDQQLPMIRLITQDTSIRPNYINEAVDFIMIDRIGGIDALRYYLETFPYVEATIRENLAELELEPEWRQAIVELLASAGRQN